MATKIRNCIGLTTTVNADGFILGGGTTTERTISVTSGNIDMVGSGSAVLTFPSSTDTIVGRATADTFTGVKTFNAGKLVLAAGSTSAAPITFTPSGTSLLTTAAQGTTEVDSAGILYYSHAASSRGVNVTTQFIALSGNYTLTDSATAQKAFNASTNGSLTVQGSTTYLVEGVYNITSTGTTSHTWGASIAGTATLTSGMLTYLADGAAGNALRTITSIYTTTPGTNVVLTGASTSATENVTITFKGILRINAGGTIIPTVKLSAGTSGTPTMLANSYFIATPLGTSSVTNIGNWS